MTSHNGAAFNLPAAPPELCFDKNEFVKKSFSVDEFLAAHRSATTMEAMRDDLGVYLKVLRSAMIELINEDYADFVNLSSNLRGLDTQIGGIEAPLQQLRSDIVAVKTTLVDTMDELTACLDEKRALRAQLQAAQAAAKIAQSAENIERLLAAPGGCDQTVLERAAMEYVQISYEQQFCEAEATERQTERIQALHTQLLAGLESHFLQTLGSPSQPASADALERCLRIFATLDETAAAEEIFRRRVVAKHMNAFISESALQNAPQGVQAIYAQVLAFIPTRMNALLALTQSADVPQCRGFDFLLRSFWPEVEQRLETHMSSIFAPGNPDQFYTRYQSTVEFLRQLEEVLGSPQAVRAFRELPQSRSFQTRWNLPVYFQIRFQEIGAQLERVCTGAIGEGEGWFVEGRRPAQFAAIAAGLEGFRRCWADGVYLPQIFTRFWKLALQILARTARWVDELVALKEWPAAAKEKGGPASLSAALVACHVDVRAVIGELPALLQLVQAQVAEGLRASYDPLLCKCLDETRGEYEKRLRSIEARLIALLVASSVPSIRQVNDIPRLFRKTNREVPSKATPYVELMLREVVQFSGANAESMREERVRLVQAVLCQLNTQYYTAVADVLTSVQKTEESLRRLKNLREKSAPTADHLQQQQRPLMSDDDKIRLQLQVDVVHWSSAIEALGIERDQVTRLAELNALVEESTRIKVAGV